MRGMEKGDPKYLRETGSFSIGGNDSSKYADNYASIFGHEGPQKPAKKKKKEKKAMSPMIKMRKITT